MNHSWPSRVMYSLLREASKGTLRSPSSNLGLAEIHLRMLSFEFLQYL